MSALNNEMVRSIVSSGAASFHPDSRTIFLAFNSTVKEIFTTMMVSNQSKADLIAHKADAFTEAVRTRPDLPINLFMAWVFESGGDKLIDTRNAITFASLASILPSLSDLDIQPFWDSADSETRVVIWEHIDHLVELVTSFRSIHVQAGEFGSQIQTMIEQMGPVLPTLLESFSQTPLFQQIQTQINEQQAIGDMAANPIEGLLAMAQGRSAEGDDMGAIFMQMMQSMSMGGQPATPNEDTTLDDKPHNSE